MTSASQPPQALRVLPTLAADGGRICIHPKTYRGRFWRGRLILGWTLIIIFVAMPLIRVNGHPVVLLDLAARKFHLFGRTFLATDGVLLMLLLLAIFVGIFWLTAWIGRAWCGWGCPQTVYMEFLFRPIESWFEGDRASRRRLDRAGFNGRRAGKTLVFVFISTLLANVFLAYFVGVDRLRLWVSRSPIEHPAPFLVMAVTALLVFLDFAWFREQMCTVVCPYARLQAVLLDQSSLIVGYSESRGEPRGKGKQRSGRGDCIDCGACVVACPTGIDIREGLQLECIACAQCVDACDSVMDKLSKPRRLVRYASQQILLDPNAKSRWLRPRVVVYPLFMVAFIVIMVIIGERRTVADITVLRGIGLPYVVVDGGVQNQLRVKIENRQDHDNDFRIELLSDCGARLIAPENPLHVSAGMREQTSVFVIAPEAAFASKQIAIKLRISDGHAFVREVPYRLLGPQYRVKS